MKSRVVFGFLFLFVLVGCNSKQVNSHTYQTSGCPVYTMPDDFVFAGSPTWSESAYCDGPVCQPFHSSANVRSFVDTYVAASSDKIPVEVCVFIRKKIVKNRARWSSIDENNVSIDGKEYHENFGIYDLKKHGLDNFIAKDLAEQGYTATGRGYLLYIVTRNVNIRIRMTIIYAYNFEFLPDDVLKNDDSLKTFLRKQFRERIRVS